MKRLIPSKTRCYQMKRLATRNFCFGCAHYSPGLGFEFACADVSEAAEFQVFATGKVNSCERLILQWQAGFLPPRNIAILFDCDADGRDVLPMCLQHQWAGFQLEKESKTYVHGDGLHRCWSEPQPLWRILKEPKQKCADDLEDAVLHKLSLPGAQALLDYFRRLAPRFDLQDFEPGDLLLSGLVVVVDQVDLIGMLELEKSK